MNGYLSWGGSREGGDVSKHQENFSPVGLWVVLESRRATYPGGKKQKPTDYMPNWNSQWRNSPDAHVRQQRAGVEQTGTGCMFRARTGHECPEDDLRELTWDSNPNCGIAWEREENKSGRERERSRVKLQGTAWTDHRTKDSVNIRGELAGCRLAPPHAGGREAGRWQPETED